MSAEEIVQLYSDLVYKIAYRYVGNYADAEDVYSETFLNYFKADRSFESEEHRKAWLIRVTINCAKDLLRQRTCEVELNEELDAAEETAEPEELMTLQQAIDDLPPPQRRAVVLFYLEGLSIREIAETMNRSEGTVKSDLSRARKRMNRFIEDAYE